MTSTKVTKKNTKTVKNQPPVKKPVEHARDKLDMRNPLSISVARFKNLFDRRGLNAQYSAAIDELKQGETRTLIDKNTKKETLTELVPMDKMSASTQSTYAQGQHRYDVTQTKRKENLQKKKETLDSEWGQRQIVLAGQLANGHITKPVFDELLSTDKQLWEEAVLAVNEDINTPPQLINKKKKEHSEYEDHCAVIQKMRYRISEDVCATGTAACQVWLYELLRHGMDNVVSQEKSFLKCQHIFTGDIEKLVHYTSYRTLPSFIQGQQLETNRRLMEEEKKQHQSQKKKEAAEAKKLLAENGGTPTPTPVPVPVPEKEIDDDDDDEDDENSIKFNHYIKQTCLHIQKKMETENMTQERLARYQSIRISEEIKTFCSNLIVEFTKVLQDLVLAELIKTEITTVNVNHIYHALKIFLLCNSIDPDNLTLHIKTLTKEYKDHRKEKNDEHKANVEARKLQASSTSEPEQTPEK